MSCEAILLIYALGYHKGLAFRKYMREVDELWIYDVGGARLPRSHFRHLPSPPMIPAGTICALSYSNLNVQDFELTIRTDYEIRYLLGSHLEFFNIIFVLG